jgi:hypothetical protein
LWGVGFGVASDEVGEVGVLAWVAVGLGGEVFEVESDIVGFVFG